MIGVSYFSTLSSNQRATYSIHIRERILGFPVFCQNSWGNLIHLAYKLEHWVIGQMSKSKFAL